MKKVMITGIAGFIGFHTALKFAENGWQVTGYDNFNDFYDPHLKDDRAGILQLKGIEVIEKDIQNFFKIPSDDKPDLVIHLAAHAGVRDSLENPKEYIYNNILATQNLIDACEAAGVENIIYASTSGVMAGNPLPSNEEEKCGHLLNPYSYSKLTNENQFACSNIKRAVGLRFFTVYGPWGRPDMALFTFTRNMVEGKPITVYNNGDMKRDFTYVDDIVQGIWLVSQNMTERDIYCIGNGKQVNLMDFIQEIEINLGNKKADYDFQPAHPADPKETWSDTTKLQKLGYKPTVDVPEGVREFVKWYKEYYKV